MFYDPERHEFPDFNAAMQGLPGVVDALHVESRYDETCAGAFNDAVGSVGGSLSQLSGALIGAAHTLDLLVEPAGFYVATREGRVRDGQGEDFFGHSYAIGRALDIGGKRMRAEISAYPALGSVSGYWNTEIASENASLVVGAPLMHGNKVLPWLVQHFLMKHRDMLPFFISR